MSAMLIIACSTAMPASKGGRYGIGWVATKELKLSFPN